MLMSSNRSNGAAVCRILVLLCLIGRNVALAATVPDCAPGDFVCKGSLPGLTGPQAVMQAEQPPSTGNVAAVEGYIWLGNVNADKGLTSATVRLESGSAVVNTGQLIPKASLVILNPVYIRGGLPKNDSEYFKGQVIVGVLEVNQQATLLDSPVEIVRPSGLTQLWAHVKKAK